MVIRKAQLVEFWDVFTYKDNQVYLDNTICKVYGLTATEKHGIAQVDTPLVKKGLCLTFSQSWSNVVLAVPSLTSLPPRAMTSSSN